MCLLGKQLRRKEVKQQSKQPQGEAEEWIFERSYL